MAVDLFVSQFSYSLGAQQFTVKESATAGRTITSAEQLEQAGFCRHWMAGPQQSAYDLAVEALKETTGLATTGAIVYATCLPANGSIAPTLNFDEHRDVKALMDFPASRLQADFGMTQSFVVGLTQQGCTSALGSLRMAGALLAAERELSSVLCVTSDRFPPGSLYEQAYNLISDGAAACVMSKDDGDYRLLGIHHITNGAMVDATDDETAGAYFAYTHRLITELLTKTSTTVEDVSWFVPRNTNSAAWKVMAGLLHVSADRVFAPTLPEIGHVISADNFVNLAALSASGRVRAGQEVLLAMAGYGMNWQAVLLEKM